jgi:hypothetical protein
MMRHECGFKVLDLGVLGPAEPAAIGASLAHRNIGDRIHQVGRDPVGEEHVPATLFHGFLAGSSRNNRLPIGRLEIHFETGLAE